MRKLIMVMPLYPEYDYGEVLDVVKNTIPDHEILIVPANIKKPEFYIMPSIEDKLDNMKMIPIESIKEVFELVSNSNTNLS